MESGTQGRSGEANRGLVIALDGPAASGKSSVGAAAAAELGYRFVDTGLLYRAVTWLALHRGVGPEDAARLIGLVAEIDLVDDGNGRLAHVAVDKIDRTAEVRGPEVDVAVSAVSGVAELRLALLTRQRRLASAGRIIMAGRDIGTVVLPDADLKIYLDASVKERAQRRVLERGIDPASAEAAEIVAELKRRDILDSTRPIAPLRPADDAVIIRTDGNAFDETVGLVVEAIRGAEAAEAAEEAQAAEAARAADEAQAAEAAKAADEAIAADEANADEAVEAAQVVDAANAVEPARAAEATVTAADAQAADTPPAVEVAKSVDEPQESALAAGPTSASSEGASEPAPDFTAGAAPEAPKRMREPRAARAPRTAIRQTPVATRMTPFIRLASAVFRLIAGAIVRLRIEGDLGALPKSGPMIIAANHASSADPVVIGAFLGQVLGRPLNWLGKRELIEFPLTGWAMRRGGIHPVDRDAADLEAFRSAMRVLEAGHVLAVFPEGTRSRDGALQRVREGVGMLALRSGAQVLPVAVVDSDLMWPRGRLLPHFGRRVTVRYGKPFVVADELERAGPGTSKDRRAATEAATRLIMTRIAELLPPRQRGVYANEVEAGDRT